VLRDTRRSSKPEYRAQYPDARPFPFPQLNLVCRQRPRTVEVMAGCRVRCAGESSSERSLKVRRLLREQEQAGALPAALTILRDANTGVGQDPHRPGCGGSTPPSCRDWVASIAAMQRSLKPQSTGQHRGDPPFHAGVAQQRQQQFRKLPGNPPLGSASLPVGPISCSRNSSYQSGRLRTARLQVRFLPGVPFPIGHVV
jgi:hypothetical protein